MQEQFFRIQLEYADNLEKEVEMKTNEISLINLELLNSNLQKDKLFSLISHDLRSPLDALTEAIYILEKSNLKIEDFQKYLPELYSRLESNKLLLENLLEWAGKNFRQNQIDKTQIDLLPFLQEIEKIVAYSLKKKEITLQYAIGEYKVFTDKNILQIILINFINNAIKFSHSHSKIQISVREEGPLLWITVRDFGMGMEPEKLSHIFETQNKKIGTGTKGEKGYGLGLMLSKSFLDRLGESIQIESILQQGTSVSFTVSKV